MPLTSVLPSLVLVWPSNWGFCTLTERTAVRPSRTSSPESVSSSFFANLDFLKYSLRMRVSALLKPTRWVPPSRVLMPLTKANIVSLKVSLYWMPTSTSTSSRVPLK